MFVDKDDTGPRLLFPGNIERDNISQKGSVTVKSKLITGIKSKLITGMGVPI